MSARLEDNFDAAMHRIAREAKTVGYNPTYFVRMISEIGGVATAKTLMGKQAPSDGFIALWERGRLDLTCENLALQPEFRQLFRANERMTARRRLEEYGFQRPRPAH